MYHEADPGYAGYPTLKRLHGKIPRHQSHNRDQIKMRNYMDRRVTPPKRVTSPNWGPRSPCKQAQFSHLCLELFFVKIFFQYLVLRARDLASLMTSKLIKKSFEFNRSICQQYDYIVNRITSSAKTTEELVDLEKYIDNLRSGPLVHLRVCQL